MNCPRCGYPSRPRPTNIGDRIADRALDSTVEHITEPFVRQVVRAREEMIRRAILKYMTGGPSFFSVMDFDAVEFVNERVEFDGSTFKHSIEDAYLTHAGPRLTASDTRVYYPRGYLTVRQSDI